MTWQGRHTSTAMTTAWTETDLEFMRAALESANKAESAAEVPVGAVVVQNQRIIGSGHNRTILDRDPSAHAEIVAMREAARAIGNHRLSGATVYVTLEPCAMCVGAMLHARIARLAFGAYDPAAGAAGSVLDLSNHRQLNHRIEVNGGLVEADCAAVLKSFFEARRR